MILDFLKFPGLVLIAGAWLLPLLKGRVKRAAMLLLPATALAVCVYLGMTFSATAGEGQALTYGKVTLLDQAARVRPS